MGSAFDGEGFVAINHLYALTNVLTTYIVGFADMSLSDVAERRDDADRNFRLRSQCRQIANGRRILQSTGRSTEGDCHFCGNRTGFANTSRSAVRDEGSRYRPERSKAPEDDGGTCPRRSTTCHNGMRRQVPVRSWSTSRRLAASRSEEPTARTGSCNS